MRKLFSLLMTVALVGGFSRVSYGNNYSQEDLWGKKMTVAEKGEYLQPHLRRILMEATSFSESLDSSPYPFVGIGVMVRTYRVGKDSSVVLISGILKGSPAESSGVKFEDLVRSVNGKPVNTDKNFIQSVEEADSRVELEVERNNSDPVVRKLVCKKALVGQALKKRLDSQKASWKKRLTELEERIQICQSEIPIDVKNNDAVGLNGLYREVNYLYFRLAEIENQELLSSQDFWIFK